MSKTTEPAAPEPLGDSEGTATQVVAGLEPVAWLNKKLPHMAILTKPYEGGGWFPVYSAATVEQLVQERDALLRLGRMPKSELRERLAAMTQERDIAKHNEQCTHDANKRMSSQLFASQAREQQLREALREALADVSWGVNSGLAGLRDTERDISDALSLPQDDTALRQWGAKLLREMADEYAQGAKDADKDSRVFLSEANARCAIHLRRKANELMRGKK